MCFSAQASFLAAGVLTFLGALALKRNRIKKAIAFAAIPLLFAIQQTAEGLLWFSFSYNWPMVTQYAPYVFLFFAFFIWPLYIPISLALIETHSYIKKHLTIISMLGFVVSLYLFSYIGLHGATAEALNCHIYYNVTIPASDDIIGTILYLMCTVVPFLLSSVKYMKTFGLMLAISYLISFQFYYYHIISIWCFFAALLSSFVYVIINELNKQRIHE